MRTLPIVILTASVLAMASFSIWQFSKYHIPQAHENLQNSTEKSVQHLQYVLAQKVKNLRKEFIFLLKKRTSSLKNKMKEQTKSPTKDQSPFVHISEWQYSTTDTLILQWKRPLNSSSLEWSAPNILKIIQTLSLPRSLEDSIYFGSVTFTKGTNYIAAIIQNQNKIYVGFLPNHFFADIDQLYKGGVDEAFIIDTHGYALAYSQRKYLGTKIEGNAVVQSILLNKGQDDQSSGQYTDFKTNKVIGAYEKVIGSNMYVGVSQMVPSWIHLIGQNVLIRILIIAMIVILVAISFLLTLQEAFVKQYEYLFHGVISLARRQSVGEPLGNSKSWWAMGQAMKAIQNDMNSSSPKESLGGANTLSLQQEGLKDLSEEQGNHELHEEHKALNHIFMTTMQSSRGMLSVILGHVQMALEKVSKEDVVEHLRVVEREARQLHNTNEKLLRVVGDEETSLVDVELRKILLDLMNSLPKDIKNKNITFSKKMPHSVHVKGIENQFRILFNSLLQISIGSIENTSTKNIFVELFSKEAKVYLNIQNTGIEIPSEILSQIFEPSYSPQKNDNPLGAKLTVIMGLIKSFGGELQINSSPTQGNVFSLAFPETAKEKRQEPSSMASLPIQSEAETQVEVEEHLQDTSETSGLHATEAFDDVATHSQTQSQWELEDREEWGAEELASLHGDIQLKSSHKPSVSSEELSNTLDSDLSWEDKTQFISAEDAKKIMENDQDSSQPEEVTALNNDLSWEDKTQFISAEDAKKTMENDQDSSQPEEVTALNNDLSWEDKTQFISAEDAKKTMENDQDSSQPEEVTALNNDLSWEDKTQFISAEDAKKIMENNQDSSQPEGIIDDVPHGATSESDNLDTALQVEAAQGESDNLDTALQLFSGGGTR